MNKDAFKSNTFSLNFLGIGQRVSLDGLSDKANVKETIDKMSSAFQSPNPNPSENPLPTGLSYDATKQWLIGLDFKALDLLQVSAVFEDPRLYGMLIQLIGDSVGDWENFSLDISYEKVNNTMGLYKGTLIVPDQFRRIDMTTCSLTLPVIGLEVYTNGDFRVDLGFPTELDFSRSFQLEAFPYKGAGGFYFGKSGAGLLSHDRLPEGLPIKTITEFGLGLELGVGKSFNKGVLKAEVGVTFQGLLEGIMAICEKSELINSEQKYYWVRGVVGVAGQLHGEVDLQIIAASVKASIKAKAEGIFRTEKPTPLLFSADVSASGEIRVGLGRLKRTITKRFNKSVEFDYELGNSPQSLQLPAASLDAVPPTLVWQPVHSTRDNLLRLYFTPQLTIEEVKGRVAKYTAMTYLDNPSDPSKPEITSFHKLLKGLFLWTMRAYLFPDTSVRTDEEVLARTINKNQLKIIHAILTGTNIGGLSVRDPKFKVNYSDISNFLAHYFRFEIYPFDTMNETECNDIPAFGFFPMLPELSILVEHQPVGAVMKTKVHEADFNAGDPCSADYKQEIKDFIQKTKVNYRNEIERSYDSKEQKGLVLQDTANINVSCNEDFFLMLIRGLLQEAIELIGPSDMLIRDLVGSKKLLSTEIVLQLSAMASRFMLFGLRLPKPDQTAFSKDTPVFPIYELTCQQFELPIIRPSDELTITLSHNGILPIIFKRCGDLAQPTPDKLIINLTSVDIDMINDLLETNIPENELEDAGVLPPFKKVSRNFPAKDPIEWNENKLWLFSDSLSKKLGDPSTDPSGYLLKKSYQKGASTCYEILEANAYRHATKVDVHIRKINKKGETSPLSNAEILYEIIGADHEGKRYLELLDQASKKTDGLKDYCIHVLFPAAPGKRKLKSSLSAEFDVIQTNLSTFSNPVSFRLAESSATIITNLFKASMTRSRGCYLRYCDGGTGLPNSVFQDALGVESTEGKISFLIVHPKNSSAASHINGAILYEPFVDEKKEEWLFFEDEHDEVKLPAFPPGHIGLWVERDEPHYDTEETNLDVYLKQQYQLISYTLDTNAAFEAQPQTLVPISPLGEQELPCGTPVSSSGDRKRWRYETIISFLDVVKTNLSTTDHPCSDPINIYAGVGEQIPILLELRDVFGNRLSAPVRTLPVDIYFFDHILSVHQWPGTRVDYTAVPLTASGKVDFQIRFQFNKQDYQNISESHVLLAKETYNQAYWQILRDDTILSIQTSLSPSTKYSLSIKEEIVRYLDEVRTLLCQESESPTDATPSVTITISVELAQSEPIFELWFQFMIERPEHLIDPAMKDVEEVRRGISTIWPAALSGEGQAGTEIKTEQSLNELAAIIRENYQIELALGPSVEMKESQRSLWGVQWGPGATQIDVIIQPETYVFAPVPLSKAMQAYTFPISPYTKEEPSGSREPKNMCFANVILQDWAKECLSFIDEMLSPKFVDAVNQVNRGTELDAILCAKKKIAEAIACSLDHVGNRGSNPSDVSKLSEAQQRLEQQLLEKLSDAFDVDAVVQHHVSVHSPLNSDEDTHPVPRLYGSIKGSSLTSWTRDGLISSDEKEYAFSNSKLPLASGDAHLTHLFRTKSDGKLERYNFGEIYYKISHLEHQIRNLPGMGTYQTSSWLSFINPIEKCKPAVEIPIVLKSFPQPLTFLEHRIIYDPNPVNLAQARAYQYRFTYLSGDVLEAQDRIKAIIDWGHTETGFNREYENLAKALAQLRYAYLGGVDAEGKSLNNGIKAHMEELVLAPFNSCPIYNALKPVTVFRSYVQDLAEAWLAWGGQANSRSICNEESQSFYTISEHSSDKDDHLYITLQEEHPNVMKTSMRNVRTTVEIEGFETEAVTATTFKFYKRGTEPKDYLKFEDRKEASNLERSILIAGLDILDISKVWAGIYQTRNEGLFEGCSSPTYDSVNEKFIFRSPVVRFADYVSPNLVTDQRFNIADLSTPHAAAKRPIKEHLIALMDQLLMGKELSIIGTVSYHFQLIPLQQEVNELKVPHLLTFPFRIKGSSEADSTIDKLSLALEELLNKKDGPKMDVGEFRIELALYEPLHNERPLLHLKGLFLRNEQIQH